MRLRWITACLSANGAFTSGHIGSDHQAILADTACDFEQNKTDEIPPPPDPEPIRIIELPLPPVTPTDDEGSCTLALSPHRTGCMGKASTLFSGDFLPDSKHVLATLNFTGAPALPDPGSIYAGFQLIIVKVDGTKFPSGDPWKCITCGVPEENQKGRNEGWDYPQAFKDGKRVLVGSNVVDCGAANLASSECIPENINIYPIRWENKADGSGSGGSIRELRIHPDDVHLGFSSFTINSAGQLNQYSYFSRLVFNPSPRSGTPSTPRYDLVNVTRLHSPENPASIIVDGSELRINPEALTVGELRGFSGRGHEVTYIGYPAESSNIDVFAADLTTGKVRRLTSHPEYVDPVDISPDDQWSIVMDTRGTDRQMWLSGMRYIPPLTDLVSVSAVASTRNNGRRRFFQPWLIDRYGDRGSYFGQKLNAAGDGSLGSINDPEWNGRADPKWSPDGVLIAYSQELTLAPDCGGQNPLPCPNSTADGGRIVRLMLAHMTNRQQLQLEAVEPHSDIVPWGTPYQPGDSDPDLQYPPAGVYKLYGKVSGSAEVKITLKDGNAAVSTVAVSYENFSDDGLNTIDGKEEVTSNADSFTTVNVAWYSDLTSTGQFYSTKKTSPDGFHLDIDIMKNVFNANGTLTTTVDGHVYKQPANAT